MPSSHRAARPVRRVKPWLAAAAVVVIIVSVVLWFTVDKARHGSHPGATSPTATASPTPSATPPAPSATPSTTPSAPSTPSSKPKPRKRVITAVPDSPPHEISIGSVIQNAGFGSAISASRGYLFPAGPTDLQRLATRGTPGSPGGDTVVIVGASNDHGTGVLDDLDQVRSGEQIVLTTRTGTLTYRITELIHANANRVLDLPQVSARVPGRLVIDQANYVNHNRSGQDLVVIATLVKAESLRP